MGEYSINSLVVQSFWRGGWTACISSDTHDYLHKTGIHCWLMDFKFNHNFIEVISCLLLTCTVVQNLSKFT